jgi:hypothetical protein
VPTEKTQIDFPDAAAEALIKKTLESVRSIQDPSLLNACRSLFRSTVPFNLRSYVAAALILRDLGVDVSLSDAHKGAPQQDRKPAQDRKRARPVEKCVSPPAPVSEKPEAGEPRLRKSGYSGEGTTLFFSMGRRQHFATRNILRVLSDVSGIEESDIGAIRTFDNYTFVNVHPAAADLIIQDVDGTSYKGRKLVVSRARPKKDAGTVKPAREDSLADVQDPGVCEAPSGDNGDGAPIE